MNNRSKLYYNVGVIGVDLWRHDYPSGVHMVDANFEADTIIIEGNDWVRFSFLFTDLPTYLTISKCDNIENIVISILRHIVYLYRTCSVNFNCDLKDLCLLGLYFNSHHECDVICEHKEIVKKIHCFPLDFIK